MMSQRVLKSALVLGKAPASQAATFNTSNSSEVLKSGYYNHNYGSLSLYGSSYKDQVCITTSASTCV